VASEGWGPQGTPLPQQASVPVLGRSPFPHIPLAIDLTLYITRLCTPFKPLLAYRGVKRKRKKDYLKGKESL